MVSNPCTPARPDPRSDSRRRRRRRGTSLVGLDIGSTAVKAVRLRRNGRSHLLVALGVEPLPQGAVVDGAIVDPDAVTGAIRQVFADHAIRNPRVAVSVAGNAVIVKRVTLPGMSPGELRASIYWEAKRCLPFDVEEVHVDYHVLAPPAEAAGDAAGERGLDVLLVAARKDRIAQYTDVVARAGRLPVVVDVDAFAVLNAYERSHGGGPGGAVALLDAGAAATNLSVVQDGQPVYTRDVALGGNAYTAALQQALGLGFGDAELLKAGTPVAGRTYHDAEPVLRAVTDDLVREVARTLELSRADGPASRIRTLVLSGGTSRVAGLAAALESALDTPVVPLDPFRGMRALEGRVSAEQRAALGPLAVVAAGLALRRVEDR